MLYPEIGAIAGERHGGAPDQADVALGRHVSIEPGKEIPGAAQHVPALDAVAALIDKTHHPVLGQPDAAHAAAIGVLPDGLAILQKGLGTGINAVSLEIQRLIGDEALKPVEIDRLVGLAQGRQDGTPSGEDQLVSTLWHVKPPSAMELTVSISQMPVCPPSTSITRTSSSRSMYQKQVSWLGQA